jgi:hypothetical protein
VEDTNDRSHDQKDRIGLQKHALDFVQLRSGSSTLLCRSLLESDIDAGIELEFEPT